MRNFEIRFINLMDYKTDAEIKANVIEMMEHHRDIKAISGKISGVLFISDHEDDSTGKTAHTCLLHGRNMLESVNHDFDRYQDQLLRIFGVDVAIIQIHSKIGQTLSIAHHNNRSSMIHLRPGFDGPQILATPDVICNVSIKL